MNIRIVTISTLVAIASSFALAEETYQVVQGDNLYKIGRKYGIRYQEIMAANNLENPNIYIGQTLKIPTKEAPISVPTVVAPTAVTTTAISVEPQPIALPKWEHIPPPPLPRPQVIESNDISVKNQKKESTPPKEKLLAVAKPIAAVPAPSYPSADNGRYATPILPEYDGVSPFQNGENSDAQSLSIEPSEPRRKPSIKLRKPSLTRTVEISGNTGKTYVVQNGDSVRSISREHGVNPWQLRKTNKMGLKRIYPGQIITIPPQR